MQLAELELDTDAALVLAAGQAEHSLEQGYRVLIVALGLLNLGDLDQALNIALI